MVHRKSGWVRVMSDLDLVIIKNRDFVPIGTIMQPSRILVSGDLVSSGIGGGCPYIYSLDFTIGMMNMEYINQFYGNDWNIVRATCSGLEPFNPIYYPYSGKPEPTGYYGPYWSGLNNYAWNSFDFWEHVYSGIRNIMYHTCTIGASWPYSDYPVFLYDESGFNIHVMVDSTGSKWTVVSGTYYTDLFPPARSISGDWLKPLIYPVNYFGVPCQYSHFVTREYEPNFITSIYYYSIDSIHSGYITIPESAPVGMSDDDYANTFMDYVRSNIGSGITDLSLYGSIRKCVYDRVADLADQLMETSITLNRYILTAQSFVEYDANYVRHEHDQGTYMIGVDSDYRTIFSLDNLASYYIIACGNSYPNYPNIDLHELPFMAFDGCEIETINFTGDNIFSMDEGKVDGFSVINTTDGGCGNTTYYITDDDYISCSSGCNACYVYCNDSRICSLITPDRIPYAYLPFPHGSPQEQIYEDGTCYAQSVVIVKKQEFIRIADPPIPPYNCTLTIQNNCEYRSITTVYPNDDFYFYPFNFGLSNEDYITIDDFIQEIQQYINNDDAIIHIEGLQPPPGFGYPTSIISVYYGKISYQYQNCTDDILSGTLYTRKKTYSIGLHPIPYAELSSVPYYIQRITIDEWVNILQSYTRDDIARVIYNSYYCNYGPVEDQCVAFILAPVLVDCCVENHDITWCCVDNISFDYNCYVEDVDRSCITQTEGTIRLWEDSLSNCRYGYVVNLQSTICNGFIYNCSVNIVDDVFYKNYITYECSEYAYDMLQKYISCLQRSRKTCQCSYPIIHPPFSSEIYLNKTRTWTETKDYLGNEYQYVPPLMQFNMYEEFYCSGAEVVESGEEHSPSCNAVHYYYNNRYYCKHYLSTYTTAFVGLVDFLRAGSTLQKKYFLTDEEVSGISVPILYNGVFNTKECKDFFVYGIVQNEDYFSDDIMTEARLVFIEVPVMSVVSGDEYKISRKLLQDKLLDKMKNEDYITIQTFDNLNIFPEDVIDEMCKINLNMGSGFVLSPLNDSLVFVGLTHNGVPFLDTIFDVNFVPERLPPDSIFPMYASPGGIIDFSSFTMSLCKYPIVGEYGQTYYLYHTGCNMNETITTGTSGPFCEYGHLVMESVTGIYSNIICNYTCDSNRLFFDTITVLHDDYQKLDYFNNCDSGIQPSYFNVQWKFTQDKETACPPRYQHTEKYRIKVASPDIVGIVSGKIPILR